MLQPCCCSAGRGASVRLLAAVVVPSLLALALASPAFAEPLQVGDPAPDFLLIGAGRAEYRAADFKGRRAFVFAWFPLAFTPG